MDHREIIKSIKAPTMVIAGKQDAGTTVEMGEFVRKNIPGASMTLFDAAHIANIECSHDYTDAVLGFLLQKYCRNKHPVPLPEVKPIAAISRVTFGEC